MDRSRLANALAQAMNLARQGRLEQSETIQFSGSCSALFPPYVYRGTLPFEDDPPRLAIAFDVVPD